MTGLLEAVGTDELFWVWNALMTFGTDHLSSVWYEALT